MPITCDDCHEAEILQLRESQRKETAALTVGAICFIIAAFVVGFLIGLIF